MLCRKCTHTYSEEYGLVYGPGLYTRKVLDSRRRERLSPPLCRFEIVRHLGSEYPDQRKKETGSTEVNGWYGRKTSFTEQARRFRADVHSVFYLGPDFIRRWSF